MATNYLCVHGHFYQPVRSDPFSGEVPREPGAEPYHDFNEKITAECYRPNARAGNFDLISFDLGPTLAEWLERHDAETYQLIQDADRRHLEKYGHGNAMAQAYNHTILPLATSNEKRIQIAWGIADFKHRFGRDPEGMWLAETAVDYETLCVMVQRGIKFTVLAPWQAASGIDTSEPYRVYTCGHHDSIVVFFFDAALNWKISFDDAATVNADTFASQILSPVLNRDKIRDGQQQLKLIASDGEVYGHHKPFRDKFLSYLLQTSAPRNGFQVATLGCYFHAHPPVHEVHVNDDTSWSCFHGVKRWMDRDDEAGDRGDWKRGLRRALNRLALRIDEAFEQVVTPFSYDPWDVLERYIQVKLGTITTRDLVSRYVANPDSEEGVRLAMIMESQYYRQLMFTSCGFFFEDLDRIEPYNDIAFAARAIELAKAAGFDGLHAQFAHDLERVRSWRTGRSALAMEASVLTRR